MRSAYPGYVIALRPPRSRPRACCCRPVPRAISPPRHACQADTAAADARACTARRRSGRRSRWSETDAVVKAAPVRSPHRASRRWTTARLGRRRTRDRRRHSRRKSTGSGASRHTRLPRRTAEVRGRWRCPNGSTAGPPSRSASASMHRHGNKRTAYRAALSLRSLRGVSCKPRWLL
jgi:hypothetical protein